VPNFTDETLNEWEVVLVPEEGQSCVQMVNGKLKAVQAGKAIIKMRLKNFDVSDPRKAVTKNFEVTINESADDAPLYIHGPDKVRLDRYANYYLIAEGEANPDDLARAYPLDKAIEIKESTTKSKKDSIQKHNEFPNVYVFHANAENKLGKIILTATYQGKKYTKTIEIIPLW